MAATAPSSRLSSEAPAILSSAYLRETAAWIRDDLDPLVAREGPNELHPDDVLTLHTLLLSLQQWPITRRTLRYSRIGLAILDICGKCTRWPAKLADEADNCVEHLERIFGRLTEMGIPLYEKGGRLYCVCEPEDITRESLIKRFASHNPSFVDNGRAYFHGDLSFKPGQWWINGMFAFRDGIIDDRSTDGGICYDSTAAYAILMTAHDEICESTPERFTYVCSNSDRGRFRLTAADFKSRHPIRILRSYAMTSLWSPRVGLRYDGLHVEFPVLYLSFANGCRYRVTGWSCKPINRAENDGVPLQYLVRFERDDPTPVGEIFKHPNAEDFDDYREYKRSIREQRDAEKAGAEILNAKNKSATETYIARIKTMTDADQRIQSNAINYMYKNCVIDISLDSPQSSRRSSDEKVDGLGRLFKRSGTTKSKKRQSHSHSYDGSHDGSQEDPNDGIDSRLHEAMSAEKAGETSQQKAISQHSPANSEDSNDSFDVSPTAAIARTALPPWNGLFTEVNWNAGRTGTRGRKLINESKVSGSIDPTAALPYTTAEARGAFEMARARKPLPANAPAFLAALSRVYHDIAMPDYVAKRVVKEADV